jgi:hypothetical protein
MNQADWLELVALLRDDRSTSINDLRQLLVATDTAVSLPDDGDPPDELQAEEALAELARRARAADGAYPFEFDRTGALITLKDDDVYVPYVFCLLLSWLGAAREQAQVDVARLFEQLATVAARQYLGAAVRFGHPREGDLPRKFEDALAAVCSALGDGEAGLQVAGLRDTKDGHLDVVAWKAIDGKPGQMILFGQCAAGGDWTTKLGELNVRDFLALYMKRVLAVEPVRAFFTPFQIPHQTWWQTSVKAGIVFDRCRISRLAHRESLTAHSAWVAKHLDQWRAAGMIKARPRRRLGRSHRAGIRRRA